MNIHEYQAKQLLAKYGVAVPKGGVAYTADEAVKVAEELGGPVWVVKSQIHAGGRGAGRFKDGDSDIENLVAREGRLVGFQCWHCGSFYRGRHTTT